MPGISPHFVKARRPHGRALPPLSSFDIGVLRRPMAVVDLSAWCSVSWANVAGVLRVIGAQRRRWLPPREDVAG